MEQPYQKEQTSGRSVTPFLYCELRKKDLNIFAVTNSWKSELSAITGGIRKRNEEKADKSEYVWNFLDYLC